MILDFRDWRINVIKISFVIVFGIAFTLMLLPVFVDIKNNINEENLRLNDIRNDVKNTIECNELKTIALGLLNDGYNSDEWFKSKGDIILQLTESRIDIVC